jgi:prephenate dehydrogenase
VRPAVGLIGYGRFGRLAAAYLRKRAEVLVYERRVSARPARSGRVRAVSLHMAASQPVVLLAVPISSLRQIAKEIKPFLLRGSVVVEVCSVKVSPVRWLRQILPSYVDIVATHPLFGPDSTKGNLRGHHLVLCPARMSSRHLRAFRRIARSHGVHVHVMSPAAHDRLVAETLLLTQYLGRLVVSARIPQHAWSAPSYQHLRELVRIAENDSEQLFADMWKYNRYGPSLGASLRRAHRNLMRIAERRRVDS